MNFTYEDAILYLRELLSTQFNDLSFADDDALTDLLIKPAAYIMYQTLNLVNNAASYLFVSDLNTQIDPYILDGAASNFFIYRTFGKPATGQVTIYFSTPDNISINRGATIATTDGKIYTITTSVAMNASQLAEYERDGLYMITVPIVSINSGADYNLPANTSFVAIGGITGPVFKISNADPITGGVDQELTSTFLERIFNELPTIPAASTRGGLYRYFTENFGSYILDIEIIGAGDPYMYRDLVNDECNEGLNFCGKIPGSMVPVPNFIYSSLITYLFRVKYDSLYSNSIIYNYSSPSVFEIIDLQAKLLEGDSTSAIGDLLFIWGETDSTFVFYGPYIVKDITDSTTIVCNKIENDAPPAETIIKRFWIMGRNADVLPIPDNINESHELSMIDYTKWCKEDDFRFHQTDFLIEWLAQDISDNKLENTWIAKQLDSTEEPIYKIINDGIVGMQAIQFGDLIETAISISGRGSRYPLLYKNIGFQKDLYLQVTFELLEEPLDLNSWAFILLRHDPTICESPANLNGLGIAIRKLQTIDTATFQVSDWTTNADVFGSCILNNGLLIDEQANFDSNHGIIPGLPIFIITPDSTNTFYIINIQDETSLYLGDVDLSGVGNYYIDTTIAYNCPNVIITEISDEGHRYLTPTNESAKFMLTKYGGVLDSLFETELFHALTFARYYIDMGMTYKLLMEVTENNAIAVKIWPDNGQITCEEAINKVKWLCISSPYIDPVVDGQALYIGLWNGQESVWRFYEDLKIWPRGESRPYSILKFHVSPTEIIDATTPVRFTYAGYVYRDDTTYNSPAIYIWNQTHQIWELLQEESSLYTATSDSVSFYFNDLIDYVYNNFVYFGITTDTFNFDQNYGCQDLYETGLYHDFAELVPISGQSHTWGAIDVYLYTGINNATTDATIESDNMIRFRDNFIHPIARIIDVREKASQLSIDYNMAVGGYETRFSTAESVSIAISDFPPGTVLEIDYEYFTNIADIQNYINNDVSMFPHQDLLVFHFVPVYVNISLTYNNGPIVDDLLTLLRNYINGKDSLSIYELKTELLTYGLDLEDIDTLILTFYKYNKAGAVQVITSNEYRCNTIERLVFDNNSDINMSI